MTKVIAISGWKRSGKDSIAEYLLKRPGVKRFGFADTLKDMVATMFNVPRSYCDDARFKEWPLAEYPVETKDNFTKVIHELLKGEFKDYKNTDYWTPRALCILIGSICRSVNSNYWVNQVSCQIKMDKENNLFVIADLRYKSEVEELRKQFGKDLVAVRVNRFTSNPSTDASETDLDNYSKFDYNVDNTGSLEDLYKQVDQLTKEIQ